MNSCRTLLIVLSALAAGCSGNTGQQPPPQNTAPGATVACQDSPAHVMRLLEVYTACIARFDDQALVLRDSSRIRYNDAVKRSQTDLLETPDVEDMFRYRYDTTVQVPAYGCDPGRIRHQKLFCRMYGATRQQVADQLVEVRWCPRLADQTIRFSRTNGAAQALEAVSDELDSHNDLQPYLRDVSTFNWRTIAGTDRLSAHSFGIAIDINVGQSDYWRWANKGASELDTIAYRNRIPAKLVRIFERHGFIWGGRWYHYDTMHFEYRPELFGGIQQENN